MEGRLLLLSLQDFQQQRVVAMTAVPTVAAGSFRPGHPLSRGSRIGLCCWCRVRTYSQQGRHRRVPSKMLRSAPRPPVLAPHAGWLPERAPIWLAAHDDNGNGDARGAVPREREMAMSTGRAGCALH